MKFLARAYLWLIGVLICIGFVVGIALIAYREEGVTGLIIYGGIWLFLGSLLLAMFCDDS